MSTCKDCGVQISNIRKRCKPCADKAEQLRLQEHGRARRKRAKQKRAAAKPTPQRYCATCEVPIAPKRTYCTACAAERERNRLREPCTQRGDMLPPKGWDDVPGRVKALRRAHGIEVD